MPGFHRLWLVQGCRIAAAAGLEMGLVATAPAGAQEEQRNVSVLDLPREGYEAPTRHLGPFTVTATADARLEYDNNVFAQNLNRTEDELVTFRPAAKADLSNGRVTWATEANGSIYRYFSQTTENHEGYAVATRLAATGDRLTYGGRLGFERTFESRNDPEARRQFGTGPRMFNRANGEVFVGIEGGRLGLRAEGSAERYNFLSPIDDERDFTSYQASLRARYRLSPRISVFALGYANWRAFRLSTDRSGVNRDSISKGGLLGVALDPGGKIRGELAAGVVNFDPRMPGLPGFTGATLRGGLVYQPRMRTAITLDVFRGDVATVRQGAIGRIDTRVRIGIQQEARHNLLMSVGAGWRKTQYRGLVGQQQSNWSADGEVEYLLNRRISIALNAQFLKRDITLSPLGNAPGEFFYNGSLRSADAFSRFRAGAEVRFKL